MRFHRERRSILVWAAVLLAMTGPLAMAAFSPLLAWRETVYIIAGFAGVFGLAIMLLQPLLAAGSLPGFAAMRGRRAHRWVGGMIVIAVIVHVGGLWITSPPDVIDALLLRSPTPFSIWGVIAMWMLFATAGLALLRKRLQISPRLWRRIHTLAVLIIVAGTIAHALLIQGTMETLTKTALCMILGGVTLKVVYDLKAWGTRASPRP